MFGKSQAKILSTCYDQTLSNFSIPYILRKPPPYYFKLHPPSSENLWSNLQKHLPSGSSCAGTLLSQKPLIPGPFFKITTGASQYS